MRNLLDVEPLPAAVPRRRASCSSCVADAGDVRDDRELDSLYRNVQFADVGTTHTRNLDRALMNDSQLKRLAAKNFAAAAAGALPSTTSKTAAAAPKPLKK